MFRQLVLLYPISINSLKFTSKLAETVLDCTVIITLNPSSWVVLVGTGSGGEGAGGNIAAKVKLVAGNLRYLSRPCLAHASQSSPSQARFRFSYPPGHFHCSTKAQDLPAWGIGDSSE
jgi:hypothetical protein